MHPLIFAVHGNAALISRDCEREQCQDDLLKLALHPFDSVATEVAKTISQLAENNPALCWELFALFKVLIAGHDRLEAAKRVDRTHVPAITLAHLTETEQRAYRIADNAIAQKSTWSLELLTAEFELIMEQDIDFDPIDLGFETAEIDGFLDQNIGSSVHEPAIADPDRDKPAVSRPGDIWSTEDVRFRIICGDAREPSHYASLLGNDRADFVFSDIPFNVKIDGHIGSLGSVTPRVRDGVR